MSHEVQGHRLAFSQTCLSKKKKNCGRCYDDVGETSVVQRKRVMARREEGEEEERAGGMRSEVTMDMVPRVGDFGTIDVDRVINGNHFLKIT